ncbi:transcriptional regulator [Sphingomonas oligophenolica]|uniref:HTH cro/C1-type domain-containing protein n=1 Tax=Sphingomonas oligophenolica TaxID=301154 RepID=A0A502CNI1_9SPHN|nr:YdaS family helix-turn-helix protein [Sphingomonas oligophenolica]TPG14383.1 hypothetical protein EAH84_03485 [Sphingomonas oligophenolica]
MSTAATPFESLKAAVGRAGSQSAFARLCGVSQTAVWKWLQSGKRLPAEHVLTVEAKTGVSRHDLRPDIYPPEPSGYSLPADHSVGEGVPTISCDRHALLKHERAA